MSGKQKSTQKTLFQTWGGRQNAGTSETSGAGNQHGGTDKRKKTQTYAAKEAAKMVSECIDLTDDDLIQAAELMEASMDSPGPSNMVKNLSKVESLPGFDNSLGDIWIYPTNYPVRQYQFNIVKNALYKNTLVSLPTGLGKTFIAAVVMYNFYRWYPQGKIVFMAPTKPLVSQQIEACYKIMGILREDQAEITGMTTSVHKREELWSSKRVFFLTPQVINNDLARGVCPATQIKCVVIDEAHKAMGKHAYCQVVSQLASSSRNFRVLALSATPGTDVKAVQQVITNLLISHLEIRSEDSIDIQGFSHQRKVEKVVCKLDENMTRMKNNYLSVIEIFTKSLVNRRVLFDRDTASYSKYGLLMARDQFRKNPPDRLSKYEMGSIEGDFAISVSLFHGLDLLQQHGTRSFYIFLKAMMEGEKGNIRSKSVLGANQTFRSMYEELSSMFGQSPNPTVLLTQAGQTQKSFQKAGTQKSSYVYSHPKMAKLEEVVVKHFQSFVKSSENDATRVMVFCQYRDSVQEITELLQQHRPLVRPMQFVGHSTASGKIAKFTQKDQLQVVSKFRSGGYNTLISTCVGEEGLDIGDVDLIVCFDAHKSPIRLVQRMGRTGRKREGRIVMLVTEGKEEKDYISSVSNRRSIQRAITVNSGKCLQFYQHNPRMIPKGLNPKSFKMHMTVQQQPEASSIQLKAVKSIDKKKFKSPACGNILQMIKKNDQKDSVFLNPEQVKEWDSKLKLSSKEKEKMKILLNIPYMESLKKKPLAPVVSQRNPTLSLSEWSLWQTREQDFKTIGHSNVTRNFVKIMETCDLIKNSGDEVSTSGYYPDVVVSATENKSERRRSKEEFLSSKIAKVLKSDDDNMKDLELSPDNDFLSEKPKKIFPEKCQKRLSDFINGSILIAHDDDTMIGIDSILDDQEQFLIKKKENKQDGYKDEGSLGTKSECFPDFDMGNWGLGDSPEDKNHSPNPKIDSDVIKGIECNDNSSNDPLDFIKTVSYIPVPSSPKMNSQNISEDELKCSPCSSISFNLENLDNDFSDSELDLKNPVKKKRLCVKSDDEDCENGKDSAKIDPECFKQQEKTSNNEIQVDNSVNGIFNESLEKNMNSDPDKAECSYGGQKNLSRLSKTNISADVGRNQKQTETSGMDVSADMFAPQFDIDFDLCEFDDEMNETRETTSTSKPKLTDSEQHSDSTETSKAASTLSQRDENLAFFPNPNRKPNIPVAEIKPQRTVNFEQELVNAVNTDEPTSAAKRKLSQTSAEQPTKRFKTDPIDKFSSPHLQKPEPENKTPKTVPNDTSFEESPFILRKTKNKKLIFSPESDSLQDFPDSADEADYLLVKKSDLSRRYESREADLEIGRLICRKKHSTPKIVVKRLRNEYELSEDEDFMPSVEEQNLKKQQIPKKIVEKRKGFTLPRHKARNFFDAEAEVSDDGVQVSSDEDEFMHEDSTEMKDFVNDATVLTQQVGNDESAIDERAMYLQGKPDFYNEPRRFDGQGAKFKLAYNVGEDIDVFSQEVPSDVSGYEQDSFVCDEVEHEDDNITALGEVTLIDNLPESGGGKQRVTRRQAELNNLCKMNQNASPVLPVINKLKKQEAGNEKKPKRKRIVCFDESTESIDSIKTSGESACRITKEKALSSAWTCSVCTLINPTSALLCQACDAGNPDRPMSSHHDTESWSCTSCTYINRNKSGICDMCGEPMKKEKPTNSKPGDLAYSKCITRDILSENPTKAVAKSFITDSKTVNSVSGLGQISGDLLNSTATSSKTENDIFNDIIPATPVAQHSTSDAKKKLKMPSRDTAMNFCKENKESTLSTSLNSPSCSHKSSISSISNSLKSEREERLKKCRQRQMEFRANMKKRKSMLNESINTPMTASTSKSEHPSTSTKTSLNFQSPVRSATDVINSSINSPVVSKPTNNSTTSEKKVILIDSKELSSSQPIITTLCTKYNASVIVASLPHCDYIIGRGTAVERKVVSDMSIVSNKQKLVARFQQLNVHYDRVYLIIEQDRAKKGDTSSSRAVHSNYYISTICALTNTNVRILYSDNEDETAGILHMLASREKSLNRSIDIAAAEKVNDAKYRSVLRLYSSIPKVSLVSALYMCLNFKNVKEVASSSVEKLVNKAHLSTYEAAEVYTFFRRGFDLQMTPSR